MINQVKIGNPSNTERRRTFSFNWMCNTIFKLHLMFDGEALVGVSFCTKCWETITCEDTKRHKLSSTTSTSIPSTWTKASNQTKPLKSFQRLNNSDRFLPSFLSCGLHYLVSNMLESHCRGFCINRGRGTYELSLTVVASCGWSTILILLPLYSIKIAFAGYEPYWSKGKSNFSSSIDEDNFKCIPRLMLVDASIGI